MSLWSNNFHGPTFRYLWALPSTEAAAARRRLSLARKLVGIDWYNFEPHSLVEGICSVREAMLVQGSSPAAINNTLSVLRGIVRTAHEIGQVTDDELAVAEAVSDVPNPKSERRLLAGWELSAVISACVRETTAKGARDAALISIMYAGGLDPRQATALEMGDWRVDDTLLRLGSRGRSHGRPLPLGEDAAALLRHWVALRDFALRDSGPDYLFLVVDKADRVQSRSMTPSMVGGILRKRAEEAKVRRFSHADLRRTAAADMLTSGAKYSEVHRILGHPIPELKPKLSEEYGALGGPSIRAIRLGSRHLDYFDVVGGFHFQDRTFDDDAENDEPEWPDSFEGHLADHIETPWGTVASGAIGDGPPVVLVHGTPWSSSCWRRVAPSFAGRHSVYAYDLLGHGESEKTKGQDLSLTVQAKILAWLIGEWGVRKPAIVGHGTGAAVALHAHLLEEVAFSKIVLVDPAATGSWLSPAQRHIKAYAEAYRTMPEEMFRPALEACLHANIRLPKHQGTLQPYLRQWWDNEGRIAYIRLIEQLDEESTTELEQQMASITVPILVLTGDTDESPTGTCARLLYEAIPRARQGRISWCGSFLPEEAPEYIAHALCCFLS